MSASLFCCCSVRDVNLRNVTKIHSLFEPHVSNSATTCTLFSTSVLFHLVDCFLLRLCRLPTSTCACSRYQRSVVAKSRKANKHAVVNSPFPVACVSLACNHVIHAMSGLQRREQSPTFDDWLLHASRLPQVDSTSTSPAAHAHFGSTFFADHEFGCLLIRSYALMKYASAACLPTPHCLIWVRGNLVLTAIMRPSFWRGWVRRNGTRVWYPFTNSIKQCTLQACDVRSSTLRQSRHLIETIWRSQWFAIVLKHTKSMSSSAMADALSCCTIWLAVRSHCPCCSWEPPNHVVSEPGPRNVQCPGRNCFA